MKKGKITEMRHKLYNYNYNNNKLRQKLEPS